MAVSDSAGTNDCHRGLKERSGGMIRFTVEGDFVKLDQLLKASNMVGSGGQAKHLIHNGLVKVNGIVVKERGKKIRPGDQVICDRQLIQVD